MIVETGNISNVKLNNRSYSVDFSQGISLAHTIKNGKDNPNCFYAPEIKFEPLRAGGFIGSLPEGSPVNFFNVFLNPHGSTTHTECAGHVFPDFKLKDCLKNNILLAQLIEVDFFEKDNGDRIIESLNGEILNENATAVILKLRNWKPKDYRLSGTNPIFVSKMLILQLNEQGMQHLLVEIPSIDKEEDGGALEAHKAFWNPGEDVLETKTITELCYIPQSVKSGLYILNLQVLNIDLDVSPSHPIVYKVLE